jgi:hypothetical protein
VTELHRRLAEHRKTLHGALANTLLGYGVDIACEKLVYVSWQKNFPRSVRDRAPGLLVEVMRRKAESAGGQRLYEYTPATTALSQTCLCGKREKKPLPATGSPARCGCGLKENRDLFAAYLGLHVRTRADGSDRLDLQAANQVGSTVRTSAGRRSLVARHNASGEAADIRPRGGPWRASTPGTKPKPRCDRAARREPPLPTGLRR